MSVMLDLTNRHWTRTRGPVTVIGTWYRNSDARWRPCMVLIRTGEEMSDETVPCVIAMDRAWVWDERIGDPAEAARMCFAFAEALRLGTEPKTIIRLASIVHDLLGDLLSIPPWMPPFSEVMAEVTVTNRTTGKSHEVALRDV